MKKNRTLKVFLIVILVIVLVFAGFLTVFNMGMQKTKAAVVNAVDLTALADGTYTGTYKAGRWTNEVAVTVRDHRITGVEITKDLLSIDPERAVTLINRVMEEQTCDVDVVTGATVTSKAYLKAIEDALTE